MTFSEVQVHAIVLDGEFKGKYVLIHRLHTFTGEETALIELTPASETKP